MFAATLLILVRIFASLPKWWGVPFGLPWWACAMPPAAVVLAVLALAEKTHDPIARICGAVAVGLLTCTVVMLFVRTGVALAAGRLLPSPPLPPPSSLVGADTLNPYELKKESV